MTSPTSPPPFLAASNVFAIGASLASIFGGLGSYYGYNNKVLLDQALSVIETRTRERDELSTRLTRERDALAARFTETDATLFTQLTACRDGLSDAKARVAGLESEAELLKRDLETETSRVSAANASLTDSRREEYRCATQLAQERPVPVLATSLRRDSVHNFTDPNISLKFERIEEGSIRLLVDNRLRYSIPVEFQTLAFPLKFDGGSRTWLGLQVHRFSDAQRRLVDVSLVRFPPKCTFVDAGADSSETSTKRPGT